MVGQITQACEVFGAHRRAGFDLYSDHPAVRRLDDGVNFLLVFGAVVIQSSALLGPGELAGEFHDYEVLHHRSCGTARLAQSHGVLTDQMACNASVYECKFWCANGASCLSG